MSRLLHDKTHKKSDTREYHTDKPETHNNGFLRPTDSFQMVMERGNPKYFFPLSEFLGSELDDDGTDLENVDSGDNYEDRKSIGHHGHDSEVCSKSERPDVTHVEFGGLDIKPEKGDERSDYEHTNSGEYEETMCVGDKGIYHVIKEEESTSESVKSVCDIDGICHRDDNEHKEWDIENTETYSTKEREVKSRVSELYIEPISAKYRENSQ